mgnify:CR=1 FL=1
MKSIVLILAFFSVTAAANNCHTEANADHNHAHDHAQSNAGSGKSVNIEINENKLNKIFDMVRNEPNNMRLGESLRNLYWDERDISRNDRQLDLFSD